jgi:hypothetical protein
MLALLMFEATDRREADTSARQGAAHRLADEIATRTASERHKAPVQANLRPPRNTRQADPDRPKLVRRVTGFPRVSCR